MDVDQKKAIPRRSPARKLIGPTVAIDLPLEDTKEPIVHIGVIVTTEDQMRLRLIELLRCAKKCHGWQTPAGMLLTEVATSATSTFHDALGMSGQQWDGVFHGLILATSLWLAVGLIKACRTPSISSFINALKNAQKAAPHSE